MHVSIIIPFFQRQPGILPRAVRSVLGQTGVFGRPGITGVELIIVDDASPVSAADELQDTVFPQHLDCRIVRQDNRGPGGARNRGLDIAADRGVVAFLDSDDEWTPEHLGRAITAIEGGYDVYGSNWIPLGDHSDAMSMPARQTLALADSPVLEDAGEIAGDPLLSEMTAPMCKLSGLVYRADRFSGLRFDDRFRNASEDVLFIYAMMLRRPRVLISTRAEVHSGRGVNVYESAEWGSMASLSVVYDQTLATKLAHDLVGARPEAAEILRRNLRKQRQAFAGNLWHLFSRMRVPLRQLGRHLLLDPGVVIGVLAYPVRRLWARVS